MRFATGWIPIPDTSTIKMCGCARIVYSNGRVEYVYCAEHKEKEAKE